MALKIINPGLFTTVQDLGRYGYESYGLRQGHGLRKLLSGECFTWKDYTCAVLEVTLYGVFDDRNYKYGYGRCSNGINH